MKLKITLVALATLFLTNCQGPLKKSSTASFTSEQKRDFLSILESDTYSSVCDLKPLIAQYEATKNETILEDILYRYTENLANSCIDIPTFEKGLAYKNAQGIKAVYKIYRDYVSKSDITSQLRQGVSIDNILAPYVPQTPQFNALIDAYEATQDPATREKIKINIERTKLFKNEGWDTYVLINVPEFKFRLFENGQKSLEFPVIVGKPTWPTPIFSSMLRYITVNPTWNVPDSIARKEIIPAIIKDKNYLKRHNMVVKRDYAPDSPTINPRKINWKEYLKPEWENKELPYKIIEQSSTRNALGRVKFLFPNEYSVYMHDTNNKALFNRSIRAFSHGCIRLSQPLRLLGHLSTYYTTKRFEEVGDILKAKKTKIIGLEQKIPVHIVYLTAYVENGMVNFHPDIYGYDKFTKLKLPVRIVKKAK